MLFASLLHKSSRPLLGLTIVGVPVLGHFLFVERSKVVQASTFVNGASVQATGLRFRSVELEVIGIAWFLIIAVLVLAASRASESTRARFRTHLFGASIVAVAWTFWVILDVGLARPQPVHYWLTAVIILSVFLLTSLSAPMARIRDVVRGLPGDLWFLARRPATWAAALCFLAILAARPTPTRRSTAPRGNDFLAWFSSQPRRSFPVPLRRAAVTIVKFNDYQCAACRSAEQYYAPLFADLEQKYPGAVSVITYDYPMEAECNDASPGRHLGACEAAVAAKLAEKAGKRQSMEAWLYANTDSLSRDTVFEAARRLGITDIAQQYETVLGAVRAEAQIGRVLGVTGTPMYYLNGVMLQFLPSAEFRAAILHELRQAGVVEKP